MISEPEPFRPPRWLRGPAAQTVLGTLLPAPYPARLPAPVRQSVPVSGEDRLGVLLTPTGRLSDKNPPELLPTARGRLLLLHGLGGSVTSRYMLRVLVEAHRRGWEVARLGFRGAEQDGQGGPGFHNAQRTSDIRAALDAIRWSAAAERTRLGVIGFSLGGAILIRYLSEAGAASGIDVAAAVAPPIDLAVCLAELERPRNRLYHAYYVHRQRRQIRATVATHRDRLPPLKASTRSLRQLDAAYVAPDAGYASAEAYYAGASARPLMGGMATPCFVLASEDDPFVPVRLFENLPASREAPRILVTRHGGHVGYLARKGRRLGFWAADPILDWMEGV